MMKSDDRLMVILTSIVLVIAVGTMVQKSDYILAAFSSPDEFDAIEDAFSVRAGRPQVLDVLSNDMNVVETDANNILIIQQPSCGTVRRVSGGLEYINSESCGGRMTFSYCVAQGDSCPSAEVTLTVALPESLENRPLIAESSFPTLRAPSLAAPNSNTGLAPEDALASVRVRPGSPSGIVTPDISASSGIGQQTSAAVSVGTISSGFGAAPGVDASPTAVPRIASVSSRPAAPSPAAPQLGNIGQDLRDSIATPAAPANTTLAQPQLTARIDTPTTAPQPQAEQPSGAVSRLRSLTSLFRAAPSSTDAAPSRVANTQPSARPSGVQTNVGLGNAEIVTERAAQVILPTRQAPQTTRAQAPVLGGGASTNDLSGLALPTTPQIGAAPQVQQPAVQAEERLAALTPSTAETPTPVAPVVDIVANCDVNLTVSLKLGEIMAATVVSECRPNEVVMFEHAGLKFDMTTDDNGTVQVDIPALNEDATLTVSFADEASASEAITVRGVDRSARVGIAWEGDINFDLHASEFGARDGSEGHVWEGAPRSYRDARRNGGGFLTMLGTPGLHQAEIYTLPVSRRTAGGTIDMAVRIGEGSPVCDTSVQLYTSSNQLALEADIRDIGIAINGCAADLTDVQFTTAVPDISIASR
jgi:hypothetical protein